METLNRGAGAGTSRPPEPEHQRLFVHTRPRPPADERGELLRGLREPPRCIAPKFFYDSHGAKLFDRITEQPEYYPTRVERELFRQHHRDIAAAVGPERLLIEPGSGSSEKVELLLESLRPSAYVPLEITESHLLGASRQLVQRYPWLTVHAVCADYSEGLDLPAELPAGPRLLFFPGSTIGNFEPEPARRFLRFLRRACGDDGSLLIGVDLRKEPAVLEAAYNDRAGVTAAFNLNVLNHVNRLVDGDFDPAQFRHCAFFNGTDSRVEMHLESLVDQTVTLANSPIAIAAGERIHTENSYKYTLDGFRELADNAGFRPRETWCDERHWFSLHLLDAV